MSLLSSHLLVDVCQLVNQVLSLVVMESTTLHMVTAPAQNVFL